MEKATFAGGCFWCFDALFRQIKGVENVRSGFAGGEGEIDYNTLHTDHKGYAEAVQFEYDPDVISYEALLDIFWHMHDPTQVNRQGADVGPEYRSVIFYHTDDQKRAANESKQKLDVSEEYSNPIATEIQPFTTFVEADEDHQDFYNKNKLNPYCMVNISPKLSKLREKYRKEVS